MNLNDLSTFVRVAELGTFTAAAQALSVPKSTVSRRVGRLEEALGVALLDRGPRSFELTEEGRRLFARSQPALRELTAVERALTDAQPEGTLRMTVPIDLGVSDYLGTTLAGFRAVYPDVRVSLTVTNRTADLLEEGLDLAMRMHGGALRAPEGVVARTVHRGSIGLYQAPSRGELPFTWDALSHHPLLVHQMVGEDPWPATPAVVVDDFAPLVHLAIAGAGIAQLPDFLAAGPVERGQLVPVPLPDAPDGALGGYRLSLLWLRTRHLAGRLRAMVDHVAAHPPPTLPR